MRAGAHAGLRGGKGEQQREESELKGEYKIETLRNKYSHPDVRGVVHSGECRNCFF